MAISKEQIEHIAKLAKINFTPNEKEKFFKEFSQILDFVSKLAQADISNNLDSLDQDVRKMARPDQAVKKDELTAEDLMINVPNKKGKLIKTKKIK